MSGKASRQKGDRMERQLVHLFQEAGIACERIPLSGSAGGSFCGDLSIPVLGIDRRAECKKRATGFTEIYRWLADHYALFIGRDRAPPLVVLRADDFVALLQSAERGRAG